MNEPESHDQDFNEAEDDFDFGEETPEVRSFSHQTSQNKKLPLVIFAIILITLLGFGYRFYQGPTSIPTGPTQRSAPTDNAPKTIQQTIAKTEAIDINIANPSSSNPGPASIPAPTSYDLEQAFAATDTTAVSSKPVPAPVVVQEPVIAPAQKELFDTTTPNSENSLSTEMMKQLTQSLDKLNQQIDYIFGKINYLDSYTHEVSQNLDKLNQSIAVMDQRLSSLSQTTQTLSADVGGVKNEVSHVKETLKDEGFDQEPIRLQGRHGDRPLQYSNKGPTHRSAPTDNAQGLTPENPEYVVHAVIPGRAWLKSSKGAIITVAEGDTIGNYGKVLLIDAAHGLVLTSSGITFR